MAGEENSQGSGSQPSPQAPQQPVKRKREGEMIVDAGSKNEIFTSKKPRYELETPKKVACLKFILESAVNLFTLAAVPGASIMNVSMSRQIANILFTCHAILRQRQKGATSNADQQSDKTGFTIKYNGKDYVLAKAACLAKVAEIAAKHQLVYKSYGEGDKENWYGVAGPYLTFFAAFDLRFKELRLGHGKMPVGKTKEGDVKIVEMTQYGLNGSHHIHLEGISYPPEKRSSMVQSLGPLTSLVCYHQSDKSYMKKYAIAAKRALSHIPNIDDILALCKDRSHTQVAPVFETIGDILSVASSRQAQRACFPILSVAAVLFTWDDSGTKFTYDEKKIAAFNLSGHGAFNTYKDMCEIEHQICGQYKNYEAAEIVYHAIFGTFKEDLGILEDITYYGGWRTREELGDCFKAQGKEGLLKFNLIKQKYYSKLTSALQTPVLATNYIQNCSAPVFSGNRKQTFCDDFFTMVRKKTGVISFSQNWETIALGLKKTFEDLINNLEKEGRKLNMGTVKWRKVDDLTWDNPGTEVEDVFTGRNIYFLGKRPSN